MAISPILKEKPSIIMFQCNHYLFTPFPFTDIFPEKNDHFLLYWLPPILISSLWSSLWILPHLPNL